MGLLERKKSVVPKKLIFGLFIVLLVAVMSLAAVACGDGDDEAGDGGAVTETTSPASGDGGTIKIGWIAWDECIATTHLWKHILEQEGYRVELIQLDAAPVYAGLAAGDIDFFTDAWLPTTHEDYWEEYSSDLEDLSIWYDKGTLELTVPSYMTDISCSPPN